MNKIITYQNYANSIDKSERNKTIERPEINNYNNNKLNKKKLILTISILFIIIIVIIFLLSIFYWKIFQKKKKNESNIINYQIDYEQYKNELFFKTKVNDIRRFSLNQISYEDMIINGKNIQSKVFRKIFYDIYIISEKECELQNKNYCNKTYTASVAKVSQCLSLEHENCEPKLLVDLINNTKTNLRYLNELNDLKDIPIELCIFNFTDTNIIISISCPESLPENTRNDLLSDLYYFRPLPEKSSERKDEFNITIENNIKNIKRISKGLCDINNKIISFCDLNLSIKKDSEGNLLSINETYISNITSDNGFNKNKITKLIDETSNNSINPDKYKIILDDLLVKLKPYLKYEENISMENFLKEYISKKIKNIKKIPRILAKNDNSYFIKEQNLFYQEFFGTKIYLNLKYDSGINTESMKSFLNLIFNEKENEIININQFSDINNAIKSLNCKTKTGNYLAYQLYETLKNSLDTLTQQISQSISNLNNIISYKDLTEIFDSSLSLNTIKVLPLNIIEESNNLVTILDITFNEIQDGNINNYLDGLNNNINDYYSQCFNSMNKTLHSLSKLGVLLNSPKNKFSEISNIYLDNTPTSYVNIIQKVNNIYLNIGHNENNITEYKIDELLINFDNNYQASIERLKKILSNLNNNLKNKSFTIENAKDEDYELIIKNLNNSNNYINIIPNKIKEKIKIINNNKKKNFILSENDKIEYTKIIKESNETAYKIDSDEIVDKIFNKILLIL